MKKAGSRFGCALIIPAVVVILLVYLVPLAQIVYLSFLDLRLETMLQYLGAPFIGFENYAWILEGLFRADSRLFTSLTQATANTFWYTFWVELGTIGFGLVIALVLARRARWRGPALSILLVPWVVPSAATGMLWGLIWRQQGGLANEVLVSWLHVTDQPVSWLILENARTALILPSIWHWLPFTTVILLVALRFIPAEIYEAASIDGANGWQKFRYLTWPHLTPVVIALSLFGIIYNFFGLNGYNIGYMLFSNDNFGRYADLFVPMLVRQTFVNNLYGAGSALSVLIILAALALLVVCYRLYRVFSERI
ncbi:MAG TPA: sugar ABC transporter permease [Anaerolineae bacterium]|nr:sugar ABC transporter permease [Anaerolineae bacterium]